MIRRQQQQQQHEMLSQLDAPTAAADVGSFKSWHKPSHAGVLPPGPDPGLGHSHCEMGMISPARTANPTATPVFQSVYHLLLRASPSASLYAFSASFGYLPVTLCQKLRAGGKFFTALLIEASGNSADRKTSSRWCASVIPYCVFNAARISFLFFEVSNIDKPTLIVLSTFTAPAAVNT